MTNDQCRATAPDSPHQQNGTGQWRPWARPRPRASWRSLSPHSLLRLHLDVARHPGPRKGVLPGPWLNTQPLEYPRGVAVAGPIKSRFTKVGCGSGENSHCRGFFWDQKLFHGHQ